MFDTELRRGGSDAEEEEDYDDYHEKALAASIRARAENQERAAARAAAAAAKPARTVNPAMAARISHNRAVDASKASTAARRAHFLASHLAAISPFVPSKVAQRIAHAASEVSAPPPCPMFTACPPQVLAVLKPHQVTGVRFLAERFHQGINPILGDESAHKRFSPQTFALPRTASHSTHLLIHSLSCADACFARRSGARQDAADQCVVLRCPA